VSLKTGDWFEALEEAIDPFDVIVCNPPYVPSAQLETLPTEISRYEPRLALDGGADGLDPYRRLAPELEAWLRSGGFAAFEIGEDQGESVSAIFTEQGMEVELRRDDGNKDRVVLVRRASGN
jgi:release factor glutamine methyltransferase